MKQANMRYSGLSTASKSNISSDMSLCVGEGRVAPQTRQMRGKRSTRVMGWKKNFRLQAFVARCRFEGG